MSRNWTYRREEPKDWYDPFEGKYVTERNAVILHATRLLFVETTSPRLIFNPPRNLKMRGEIFWFDLSPNSSAIESDWEELHLIYAPNERPRPLAACQMEPFFFSRRLEVEEFLSIDHVRTLFMCMIRRQEIPSVCLYKEGNRGRDRMLRAWGIEA